MPVLPRNCKYFEVDRVSDEVYLPTMTFFKLAKLLHEERTRHFQEEPFVTSLSDTLSGILEMYEDKHSKVFPSVRAAIRQFSRTRKLTWSSQEEADALRWRFDFAIAVLLFLSQLRTEEGRRIITEPDPAIPEEDLIEWALLAIFTYERLNREHWALEKFKLEGSGSD
jgi:hypothetical protein